MRKSIVLFLLLAACGKSMDPAAIKPTVERSKDPVCNMWVEKKPPMATFDNTCYYFCCQECANQFNANPTKFVKACDCKKTGHRSNLFPEDRNCKCEHCEGKQVPCDCNK